MISTSDLPFDIFESCQSIIASLHRYRVDCRPDDPRRGQAVVVVHLSSSSQSVIHQIVALFMEDGGSGFCRLNLVDLAVQMSYLCIEDPS